jgi:U3 small nucleolar RNA-associated protein 23
MRLQRNKQNRKTLNFLRLLFGVHPPYRVLLDGNFLATCARFKIEWRRLLPKLLQVDAALVHLHVTECVLAELESLGERAAAAAAEARALPLLKCRAKHAHAAACAAAECLAQLVGGDNAGKWFVVTQDAALRADLRRVPGVALALISSNVLVLEPPSAASRSASAAKELPKSALRPEEAAAVKAARKALRRAGDGDAGEAVVRGGAGGAAGGAAGGGRGGAGTGAAAGADAGGPPRKKRQRGPSEPNPLSRKKKSKGAEAVGAAAAGAGGAAAAARPGNRRKE